MTFGVKVNTTRLAIACVFDLILSLTEKYPKPLIPFDSIFPLNFTPSNVF